MSSCLVVRSWPVLSRAAGQARTAAQLGPRRSFQQAEVPPMGLESIYCVQLVSRLFADRPAGLFGGSAGRAAANCMCATHVLGTSNSHTTDMWSVLAGRQAGVRLG